MKIFMTSFIVAALLLTAGCAPRVIPLLTKYQDKPYEFTLSDNKDLVWNKLIDLFTAKGLPIKTIDKNDGLIITDITSFVRSYTWENKDGSLINPDAYIVCSKFRGPFTLGTSLTPAVVTGQWIVRMKQDTDKIIVNVKLANTSGKVSLGDTDSHSHDSSVYSYDLQIESTGVFEKLIEDALK